MRAARSAALLWLGGVAAGCVPFRSPALAVHTYRLDYAPPAIPRAPLPAVLRLLPFEVAAVYDRDAIVYRDGPYVTGTYAAHRWSAAPGEMVADLLARDFAASGLYRAVQRGAALVGSHYALSGELEEIEEQVHQGRCAAHLRLRVLLVRAREGPGDAVLLRHAYSADEPCGRSSAAALAAAMSRALAQLSEEIQRDVYEAIAADISRR